MITLTTLRGGKFPHTLSTRHTLKSVHAHGLKMLLLIALLGVMAPAARATSDISQSAVNRAHQFLNTDKRAKDTLAFVHAGTTYHGQKYLRTDFVTDDSGQTINGRFALVYRLFWNDDGVTDIAYRCYPNGNVYAVKIMYTNAEGNQPFLWANVSIQVLGNLLIDAYKDKLSVDDRRQLQKLVDNADAKGLLEWSLKLDQFFWRD
ncbi:MAG TPA: hypothetical protein VKY85_18180 [Candidatus Angelobacter sp.]|nr:hypothetical protein [Candidatus Angelobacter sp.]